MAPQTVDERTAAEILDLSRSYLRQARGENPRIPGGPPYYKYGRAVRYDVTELIAWRDARRVDPASPTNADDREQEVVAR